MPDLHTSFINEVVLHKLSQQQIDPEASWFDESGMLDIERVPSNLRGPVQQMFANAERLADSLLDAVVAVVKDDQ